MGLHCTEQGNIPRSLLKKACIVRVMVKDLSKYKFASGSERDPSREIIPDPSNSGSDLSYELRPFCHILPMVPYLCRYRHGCGSDSVWIRILSIRTSNPRFSAEMEIWLWQKCKGSLFLFFFRKTVKTCTVGMCPL